MRVRIRGGRGAMSQADGQGKHRAREADPRGIEDPAPQQKVPAAV